MAGSIRRTIGLIAGFTAAGLAVFASSAAALPPKLENVSASGGVLGASWTLPSTVATQFFEVGAHNEVNAYGYFQCNRDPAPSDCEEGESNIVRFGVLGAGQTSLAPTDATPALLPGTYYVHIAGHDKLYTACPQVEFSETWAVTIGADGNAVSTEIVGPGTGQCTLRPGSASSGTGGGGGGGGGGAVAGDKLAPTTQLRYTKRQKLDRLRIRARMSEPGTLTVRALVDTSGLLARIYNFRPRSRRVTGGVLTTFKPRLAKRNKRALKRALRRKKRLRVRVTVTATDRAGNRTTRHATIRLKR